MTTEHRDVLVLGGGCAGLAAAAMLAESGVDVAIVEARSRLGGRIWTVRVDGHPIELGAEFVHGDAPRTTAIAREGRLAFEDVRSAQRWQRGGDLSKAPECDRSLHEAVDAATRIAHEGADRSFVEALGAAGVAEPGRRLALEYVQSLQAADADRISARALSAGDIGDENTRRLVGGYDRVVHALATRLPPGAAMLSHVVQAVRWRRRFVEVLARPAAGVEADRTFTADRAIVAWPLGVLREVRFAPALASFDAKANAMGHLASGHAMRVAIRFREPFWQERVPTPAFLHVPGAAWPVLWTGPRGSPLLVAWAGGPAAKALEAEGLDANGRADRALEVVSRAFGIARGVLDDAVAGTWTHDWTQDPFSRGAYSYPLVGGADAARSLAMPLEETLFFAGEVTSDPPANGTVEGALESGHRAAHEVLRALELAAGPVGR